MKRRLWSRLMALYEDEWAKAHPVHKETGLAQIPKEARKITSHMLRHTFISTLYDAGIDVKTAQKWAGHATVSVLMDIYTHLSESKEKEAENKLKRFVSGGNFDDNFDDTDDNLTTQRMIKNVKD